jgi:hypothetical protein
LLDHASELIIASDKFLKN